MTDTSSQAPGASVESAEEFVHRMNAAFYQNDEFHDIPRFTRTVDQRDAQIRAPLEQRIAELERCLWFTCEDRDAANSLVNRTAEDAIDLYVENREVHGYDHERAKAETLSDIREALQFDAAQAASEEGEA